MRDFAQLIQQCEEWIRAGHADQCASVIQKLNPSRIPSNYRRELASLARRIGQPYLGLRLMTPLFKAGFDNAKPANLAEYAVLLQRCGANSEAMSLLNKISPGHVSEASLYRAFAHFAVWEYREAIPHLHSYIASPVTAYWRLVGRVNLADALIFTEQFLEAREVLEQLVSELRPLRYNKLLGNCMEMLGQIFILQNELPRAETCLSESASLLGQTPTLDRLYLSRWQSVLKALKQRKAEPLLQFRVQALSRNEFESVRQADFFLLKLNFDRDLFAHIYVGTPYASYREKLELNFGGKPADENYIWGSKEGRHFHVADATLDGDATDIKGLKTHALITELTRDFYRPKRVAQVFSSLWPNEHFNIFSSPQRVHQAAARTRRWFEAQQLNIRLEASPEGYRLIPGPSTGIVVAHEIAPALAYERHLHELRKNSSDGFTKREACAWLGVSPSAFRRFSEWAIYQGKIQKFGASSMTRYFFPSD